MPEQLTIAIIVLGAVMLLLALVSGGFKIFGAEIPGVAGRTSRIIAFVIGLVLVGFSLAHFQDGAGQKDKNPPKADSGEAAANPPAASTQPAADDHASPKPDDVRPPPKPALEETLNDPTAVRMFGQEGTDFGVSPRDDIQQYVSAPTPLTIPGAQTISTGELYNALRMHRRMLLIDVLDRPHAGISGARRYPGAGMPNPPSDLSRLLERDTGGSKSYPLVFYCQGPQCWESYNAALRARDAGYANVYWYRGGLEAWGLANLPMS